MIKREYVQRVIPNLTSDDSGGQTAELEYKEKVPAHVSEVATTGDITQYGVTGERILHTVTDYELDRITKNARYAYGGKLFEILNQIKNGNEYFQVMKEVTN